MKVTVCRFLRLQLLPSLLCTVIMVIVPVYLGISWKGAVYVFTHTVSLSLCSKVIQQISVSKLWLFQWNHSLCIIIGISIYIFGTTVKSALKTPSYIDFASLVPKILLFIWIRFHVQLHNIMTFLYWIQLKLLTLIMELLPPIAKRKIPDWKLSDLKYIQYVSWLNLTMSSPYGQQVRKILTIIRRSFDKWPTFSYRTRRKKYQLIKSI